MPMSDKKRASDARWKQKNKITVGCSLYRADADELKRYAAARGQTVNELFREYVAACLGRPLERRGDPADGGQAEEEKRPPA